MNKILLKHLCPFDQSSQNMLNTISGNLLFNGKDKKSFVVTSCHDGEGKTTAAIQLAYTLAQNSYQVVIVDADAAGSTLLNFCEENSDSDNEKKNVPADNYNLSNIVYTTDVSNLYIIPHTNIIRDHAMLIDSATFADLIETLSHTYDFIIVDTPSAGKKIDAAKIASICDGIILVVQYRKTKKKDIAEVVRQLEKSGSPMIGCVINKVKFDCILSRKRYRLLRTPLIKQLLRRKRTQR